MTLNFTTLGADYVVQVSDRRLTSKTSSGSIHVDDDDANKAVVLSCSDSLLAITFTGLGSLDATRVDEWLLKTLQEEALCELEADIAVEKFSSLATDWFQTFRSIWFGLHTFIFAGWQQNSTSNQSRARLWFVTNADSVDYSSFATSSPNNIGTYVTGCLTAFTSAERLRVEASLLKAKNIEQIEEALVDGIRCAASQPDGVSIGKSCMSVSLAPPRTAVTRFHPHGAHPHNFGPHVVWYEGGRNLAVKGIDHLPAGQYSLVFGGGAGAVVVRPERGIGLPPSPESFAKFDFRFTDAKYHSEPVTTLDIVKIIAD